MIELMITIALLAILLGLAIPSMTSFLVNSELRSAVNTLQADTMNARSEAIKLARPVVVRPVDVGNGWVGGWQTVVLDTAGNDAQILVTRDAYSASYLSVGANSVNSMIRYDSAGFARTAAGAFLAGCVLFNAPKTSRSTGLIIDAAGRPRVCKGDLSTPCCA